MKSKSFTPFPILNTKRLTLRQLSTDDDQNILELRSDPEINKYLDRQESKTTAPLYHRVNDNTTRNDSVYWAITLTSSGKFVGTICLFNFSDEKYQCETGYELLINFQRQGIMKEAMDKVIDYVFQALGFHQMEAFTHKNNRNSTKLLTKFDFKKTGSDEENPDFHIFSLIDKSSVKNIRRKA